MRHDVVRVFVSSLVLVFVRAILSWCPLTWHVYIVATFFVCTSLQFILLLYSQISQFKLFGNNVFNPSLWFCVDTREHCVTILTELQHKGIIAYVWSLYTCMYWYLKRNKEIKEIEMKNYLNKSYLFILLCYLLIYSLKLVKCNEQLHPEQIITVNIV